MGVVEALITRHFHATSQPLTRITPDTVVNTPSPIGILFPVYAWGMPTIISSFIEAMDYVVPGFAAYETLLYSPELKFYSNRVKMDTDFNTSLKGLHCLE